MLITHSPVVRIRSNPLPPALKAGALSTAPIGCRLCMQYLTIHRNALNNCPELAHFAQESCKNLFHIHNITKVLCVGAKLLTNTTVLVHSRITDMAVVSTRDGLHKSSSFYHHQLSLSYPIRNTYR